MIRTARSAALVAALLFAAGCATVPNPAMGSWVVENYSGDRVQPNVPTGSTEGRSVKILTEDRFAFGYQDGSEPEAGGGRYEVEDGVYREMIEYHWIPALVGQTVEFEYEIDGDVWYHDGTLQMRDRTFEIHEVWRRIGPQRGEEPVPTEAPSPDDHHW